jgi:hypothetical protein
MSYAAVERMLTSEVKREVSEDELASWGLRPFEMPEHELAEQDALHMLGGNWLSRRYTKRPEVEIDRDALRGRLSEVLVSSGWTAGALPNHDYVMSKIYETGGDDMYYTHPPFSADDEILQYNLAIHVSEKADVIVLYYELVR